MPREWCTAPAILPVFSNSGASRTSSTSALPFVIRSRACAGVIFGTAAFAVSLNCLTLVVIFDSLMDGTPRVVDVSEHETLPTIKSPTARGYVSRRRQRLTTRIVPRLIGERSPRAQVGRGGKA